MAVSRLQHSTSTPGGGGGSGASYGVGSRGRPRGADIMLAGVRHVFRTTPRNAVWTSAVTTQGSQEVGWAGGLRAVLRQALQMHGTPAACNDEPSGPLQ